jgi:hypothetical protein
MGEDGRDNGFKDLLRLFEESGYEGEGWYIADGEWMIAECTWTDIARVAEERWGSLIEGGDGRGLINLERAGGHATLGSVIYQYGLREKHRPP